MNTYRIAAVVPDLAPFTVLLTKYISENISVGDTISEPGSGNFFVIRGIVKKADGSGTPSIELILALANQQL